MRERLAVRAGAGRLQPGIRPDGEDRVDVARLDRVVHDARGLGAMLRPQLAHDRGVELLAAQRGQALLDRPAGELVPECEAVGADLEHAGLLGLGERVQAAAEQSHRQRHLDVRRHDRQLVERVATLRPEPADAREHGLEHAHGHVVGRRRERLRDEERVPAR